jgi:tetratricopeptide (TPR) repeat protein
LGKYYERRGVVEQALAHYEQSALLAESENTTDPLEFLAQLLGQSGNNLRSMDLYRQLTAINPGSASAWTGLGNNLWALGQLEEAEPDNWIACNNLVLVLTQLGRTAEATRYQECASNPLR